MSIAQTNLKDPQVVDWNNYSAGSKFQAPPPASGPDGKSITYYGVGTAKEIEADDDYLQFMIDPIKLVKAGSYDGYTIKFTRASVKPKVDWKTKEPKKGNPNKVADYLRSTGVTAKPQTNDDYRAAVAASNGKPFPFILDWEAYNRDTGEKIQGYEAFPIDPETGQRKAILRQGDFYNVVGADRKPTGQTAQVKSEILFANARLRFFQDPQKQRS